MPINAAILDVDGTVATCPYDFDAMRAAIADIAARHGLDAKMLEIRGVIEHIDALAARLGDDGPAFREEATRAVVNLEVTAARGAELLPGAAAALQTLRQRGVSVALITRNCRAATDIVLRKLPHYDLLLTRDDVPRAKPDPDHVHRSLAALGAAPDRTAVVGDHTYDMQAGRAAGVRICLGVRTGSSPDLALLDAGAHAIIDSIADLPDWLQNHRDSIP
ncbi:MAG: HAD family hydrolase [Armatimonadota bacterium]|nr:MAG: HAD family hydrolase [Armatimonadota bacterium]